MAEAVRPGQRMFPARSGSAIPVRPSSDDPAVIAGKLWEQHVSVCDYCESATPGCDLGRACYEVYEIAASQSPSDYLRGAIAITAPTKRDIERGVGPTVRRDAATDAGLNHRRDLSAAATPSQSE